MLKWVNWDVDRDNIPAWFLLGLIFLVPLAIRARRAERAIRIDKFQNAPGAAPAAARPHLLLRQYELDSLLRQYELAKGVRSVFEPLRLPRLGWLSLGISATLFGVVLYWVVIAFAYGGLDAALAGTEPTFMSAYLEPPSADELVDDLKARYSLSDEGVLKDLKAEIEPLSTDGGIQTLPAVRIATGLALVGACQSCNDACRAAVTNSASRLLAGRPGEIGSDIDLLKIVSQPPKAEPTRWVQKSVNDACAKLADTTSLPSFFGPWSRSPPWSASKLAFALLGPSQCLGDNHDRCNIVTKLFQSALDAPDVRAVRAGIVNFFYGWERTLVFILFLLVTELLLYYSIARLPLEEENAWLQKHLLAIENQILTTKKGDSLKSTAEIRTTAASALAQQYHDRFSVRGENERKRPVEALVLGAQMGMRQSDTQYVRAIANVETTEVERSREILNAIITIFPVVGFAATLLGLVFALAGANEIATSTGDQRSSVILDVTALLSSCFATTFLALVSMALFAVINLLQGNIDKRLLTGLAERLDTVLRPGHVSK